MATKNNPGAFDCYDKAAPDEPMFVLLGRDPTASFLVWLWVKIRRELGHSEPAKMAEAEACATALSHWAQGLGMATDLKEAREATFTVLHRLVKEAIEG
jgi:hypothetical protein